MNMPWEDSPSVWASESKFWQWMRGNLRKALWQHYPVRTTYKKEHTWNVTVAERKKYNLSNRVKRVGRCELTGEIHAASNLEVDHISPAGSLKSWEDVGDFIGRLLCPKENMRLVSKEAHRIHTYAERWGMTFEEAKLEKEVIAFSKLTTSEQSDILISLGFAKEEFSNATKRKNCYRKHLLETK